VTVYNPSNHVRASEKMSIYVLCTAVGYTKDKAVYAFLENSLKIPHGNSAAIENNTDNVRTLSRHCTVESADEFGKTSEKIVTWVDVESRRQ
jgi:hypothetical protein